MKPFQHVFLLFLFSLPITGWAAAQRDTTVSKKDTTARTYFRNRFSEYEPNYFISDFGQSYYGQVKFKISFKFDLTLPFEKNKAYFAYTQTAFWDLYGPSAPMRELDFTPTLFFEHDFYKQFSLKNWHFTVIDFKVGYLHQSDGQPDGPSTINLIR